MAHEEGPCNLTAKSVVLPPNDVDAGPQVNPFDARAGADLAPHFRRLVRCHWQ